ncbi:hypothetical protein C8J56DRAFT_1050144 [Mycena floridula]|nr:hypothetical protein C8J56DRAFT_1050144 [Mycena floridula]
MSNRRPARFLVLNGWFALPTVSANVINHTPEFSYKVVKGSFQRMVESLVLESSSGYETVAESAKSKRNFPFALLRPSPGSLEEEKESTLSESFQTIHRRRNLSIQGMFMKEVIIDGGCGA